MKIKFSRSNSPLEIHNEAGKYVGKIVTCYKRKPCPTCGSETGDYVITAYSLEIKGRYWSHDNKLRPKGSGGFTCVHRRRLTDLKAFAEEVLGAENGSE